MRGARCGGHRNDISSCDEDRGGGVLYFYAGVTHLTQQTRRENQRRFQYLPTQQPHNISPTATASHTCVISVAC